MSIKQDEKVMSESHSKEQGVEHIGADIPSAFSKSLHSEKADESGLASGSAPLLTGDFLSSQDSSASFSLSSNLYKSSESFQNDVSGMSSFGSDLDLSSENSILSRIQVFEDASEAELPIDADRSVSSGGKGTKIGSVLDGKYRIERTVAKGGMGVVYCANHVKLNKTFAIKVISPTTLAHEEAHKRFFREAKASTLLTNPHTVRVFDYGVSLWGEPYLVMEFVSGDNLHKAVKEQGAFEPRRVVSVI